MSIVWWEKTVEYAYVALMSEGSYIVPLAGKAELLGDALGSMDGREWFLIEFKRCASQFSSELKKFAEIKDDDGNTLENIYLSSIVEHVLLIRTNEHTARNEPHYFIYSNGLVGSSLHLLAKPYWGAWMEEADISDLPSYSLTKTRRPQGWPKAEFDEYTRSFLLAKSGGIETVSSGAYSTVMGVSAQDGSLVSMSLADYAENYLNFNPEPPPLRPVVSQPRATPSSRPSFG